MARRLLKHGLYAYFVACGLACAAATDSVDEGAPFGDGAAGAGVVAQPIINGFATNGWPEVGKVVVFASSGINSDACTGTLISSRVIITAAHCFDYNRGIAGFGATLNDPPVNTQTSVNARFEMYNPVPPSGQAASQSFVIRRVFVHGLSLGERDIAVAELDRDVDPGYATPLPIATTAPAQGANVTAVGYGCTSLDGTGAGQKRQRGAVWQAASWNTVPDVGCYGDSGGPIVNSAMQIVALISGPGSAPNTDLNARAVTHRATIDRINAIYGSRQVCTTCPIISLKTADEEHYLRAPQNGGAGATLNASATVVGPREQFRLVQFTYQVPAPVPSWVALQATSGRWVGALPNTSGEVKTTRDRIFDNEMFFLENRGYRKWSLKTNSFPTRYFLTAENGGGGTVSSNRTTAGPWETFGFNFP